MMIEVMVGIVGIVVTVVSIIVTVVSIRQTAKLGEGFEGRIGEKLRESAWIGNLRIPRVRNFMLGRMAAMSQQGIECRLEVPYPMERADGSKEYLFRILEQVEPELSAEHEQIFAFLNDNDMFDISREAFVQGMTDAERLIQEVDAAEDRIVETFGSEAFAFAMECARSLYKCCDIRKSDNDYNQARDAHMAEKVQWFIDHGDGSVLFIKLFYTSEIVPQNVFDGMIVFKKVSPTTVDL